MPIEKLKPTFSLESERIEELKQIIPEAFADGKINWETLKELLAPNLEDESDDAEHFGLNWPGKRQARRLASMPSKGTLVPVPGEGVDEDTTQNIFIEGDNLEVLKLMQKSYAGRIKMIYIDPPYNTGNDFIYKDDYSEPLESYLKRTGQADEEGKLLVSNTRADGRFHSNWLSMMYPRLRLARNLLRDDGFIVISIDDDELSNLTQLMNIIFGGENRIAVLVWDKNRKNDAHYFSVGHEYMVIYAKDEPKLRELEIKLRAPKEGVDDVRAEFNRLRQKLDDNWELVTKALKEFFAAMDDDDPRKPLSRFNKVDEKGPYRDDGNINWPGGGGPRYEVVHPVTGKPCKNPRSGWRFPTKERFDEEFEKGRIIFGADENKVPSIRTNLFENVVQVMTSVDYSYAQTAANEFDAIFDDVRVFDNPKPVKDLVNLIRYLTDKNDIVLDFFAGAGTTAHAVVLLNSREEADRKYICVQIPEDVNDRTATGQNALSLRLGTVAEIAKERIKRVISRELSIISSERESSIKQPDVGFCVFKLNLSNMLAWRDVPEGADLKQLQLIFEQQQSSLIDNWKWSDVLTEILLLEGFPLHSKITKDESFNRNKVFRIESDFCAHRLFVSLDADVFEETIRQVTELPKEDVFICLDSGLSDTDKTTLDDNHPNSKTI